MRGLIVTAWGTVFALFILAVSLSGTVSPGEAFFVR